MTEEQRRAWQNVLEWTQSRDGSYEALEEALDTIASIARKQIEVVDGNDEKVP